MTKQEWSALRSSLQARLVALSGEIGDKQAIASADRSDLQGGTDRGDLAAAESERDLGLSEAERDIDEARLIEAVIARIDDNSYGLCSDCGEVISAERLAAQPLALRCIACQARAEKRSGRRISSL